MAGVIVNLNEDALQEYLDGQHGVREVLEERATPVLEAAQADPHDDTGAYQAGLHLEAVNTPAGIEVRVVSSDWKTWILEARYGILARAMDAAQ